QYLDHPSLAPFWERAEALGALIYLHPADPVTPAPVLDGHKGLRRATWEWTFETGSHALRLIFGGLFDRFPRARIGLGHLGETLPFSRWRFDSRAGPDFYAIKLARRPSEYFRDNFVVTTSGMCSAEPLNCTIAALGHERIMFGADYPFEKAQEAGHFIDSVTLSDDVRADICFRTPERLLGVQARTRPWSNQDDEYFGTHQHRDFGPGARAPLAGRAQRDARTQDRRAGHAERQRLARRLCEVVHRHPGDQRLSQDRDLPHRRSDDADRDGRIRRRAQAQRERPNLPRDRPRDPL